MTDLLTRRQAVLGPNVPTFYDAPVEIVRGEGVWLWDADGKQYLDCYNNVPHVGHCHPKVVEAITRQASTLNTHTRYLHQGILDYGERLAETFNSALSQMIMVCTGSEANDIALRMAQAVTGKTGIIATDNTYHGNTTATAAFSTRRPPIGGYPDHVRLVPAPDTLRPLGGTSEGQGQAFADQVTRAAAELEANGSGFSGLMICPSFANEGMHDLPRDFLKPVAKAVKAAGGLLLVDEVQPGFGRSGTGMWVHEWSGIAPDVVTLGKPMANGHPTAAVVATPDVMAAFRNAFGYFNTFGGNPVSCAAASAVLDIIEEDELVTHAADVGAYTLGLLRGVSHPAIVNVRGQGQFYGVELEIDGAPATELARRVVETMKENGVLMGVIGRKQHILKMRPPMPFDRANADLLAERLQESLNACPI
ncbi:aspartate aminotransferase family protein [Shimia ponticola]|uniref:aspartate aminotransferase family protein n=1 Tax=Shimia ponticola TaxID=2582893 RepID=UPI0011BFB345|nr:aminotransferase class III-fold pyridoxal phosphate-dependent enzyme [Shimia ponticola]